jgi:hypothetical protein
MFNVRAFDSAQEIVTSSERQIAKRQCTIYKELQQNVQVFNTIHPVKLNGYTYNRNVQEVVNVCDISCGKVSYASSYEMLADVRQGAQLIYPDACCECITINPLISYLYAVGTYTNQPLRIYNADGTLGRSLANAGGYDAYVVKYTDLGAVSWAAHIGGTADENCTSITIDQSNNVYVVGYYTSNPIQIYNADGQLSGLSLINLDYSDALLVKYDSNGLALWATHIGGSAQNEGRSIVVDQSNNVYVGGGFDSAPLLIYNADGQLSGVSINSDGSNDAFLVKYDPNGFALWAAHVGNVSYDNGYSVTPDQSNNVYICGLYQSDPLLIYSAGSLVADLSLNLELGVFNAFLVKYDSNGLALWATHMVSPTYDIGFSTTTDQSNNVYVGGVYASEPFLIYSAGSSVADLSLNDPNGSEAFLVKYDSNGIALWATHVGGASFDVGNSVTVDQTNNVYISGSYVSSQIFIYNADGQLSGLSLNVTGTTDAFLVKYDSNGFALWATHISNVSDTVFSTIKTDLDGNVYIGGAYTSANLSIYNADGQLSPLILTNTGPAVNSYIVKYDSNGLALWASQTGDLGDSLCSALAFA